MRAGIRPFITLAAAAAVLLSCNQKEMEVAGRYGVVYRFELLDGGTRATLGEEGVFWETGDQVGLYLGTTHGGAPVREEDGRKVVEFTAPAQADGKVYAYYPYNAANTTPQATRVLFPASQEGGPVSAMPMAGVPVDVEAGAVNGRIRTLNLGAVIDFRVFSTSFSGEQVRSIRLTAASGDHPVSGEATLDLTRVALGDASSLALSWPAGASGPSSVTLTQTATVAGSKDESAAGHLYMVVAPGTYSGEITIVTGAASYTFPFEGKEFRRNEIRRFNMDLDSPAANRVSYYVRTGSAGDGGPFLVAFERSPGQVALFHPTYGNSNRFTGESVDATVMDKGILSTPETDACQVILEKASGSESSFYIKVPGAGNRYLYLSNNSLSSGQNPAAFTFDGDGNLTVSRTTSSWWSTSTYFLSYAEGTFFSSNSSCLLALYKPDDGAPKEQFLRFSTESFPLNIAGLDLPMEDVAGVPVLSGARTAVTYTSGNPAVATVDPAEGRLTVHGTGRTVITATAEATGDYLPATASYTLKVSDGFCLENDTVAAFMDYVEDHPYDPADYSYSYVEKYSSASSSANRLDLPKPVPLSWETAAAGTPTVLVYNDAARTDREPMANVSITSPVSAEVYSLIPGRTYHYVVMDGETELASGSFRTTGRRRMIKVGDSPYGATHANNCRDFGGLPAMDGKTVRFGKIYRGTNMDETTDIQKTYLLDYMHIGLDVDLRETGTDPANEKGKYQKDPLGLGNMHTTERYDNWQKLSDPERMRGTLTHIFDAVDSGTGVYIHCKVGADRTAYVCLLLEAILGVPQDLCDIDYELSSFCSDVEYNPRRRDRTNQTFYYYTVNGIPLITGQPGSSFQEKAIHYLTDGLGIPAERITAFQSAMLE